MALSKESMFLPCPSLRRMLVWEQNLGHYPYQHDLRINAEHVLFATQGVSAAAKDSKCSTWHIKRRQKFSFCSWTEMFRKLEILLIVYLANKSKHRAFDAAKEPTLLLSALTTLTLCLQRLWERRAAIPLWLTSHATWLIIKCLITPANTGFWTILAIHFTHKCIFCCKYKP